MVIGPKRRVPDWTAATDEEIFDLRLNQLGLSIEGSPLEAPVRRLRAELRARGLAFVPHVWLSSAWFSPDGVPGFAIPFYLAHPRLTAIERRMMGHVEGDTAPELMKLLRHESGHAIATAYRLHRKRSWRETFGLYSEPYCASYLPDPLTTRFVRNLDYWYAQSHPAEDWCETFALCIRMRFPWRARYRGWPARTKLEYVDSELSRLKGQPATVVLRERTEAIGTLGTTLREYYRRKQDFYRVEDEEPEDARLREVFPADGEGSACDALWAARLPLLRAAARRTRADLYTVDQAFKRLAERAFVQELRVPPQLSLATVLDLLCHQTERLLNGHRFEYAR